MNQNIKTNHKSLSWKIDIAEKKRTNKPKK